MLMPGLLPKPVKLESAMKGPRYQKHKNAPGDPPVQPRTKNHWLLPMVPYPGLTDLLSDVNSHETSFPITFSRKFRERPAGILLDFLRSLLCSFPPTPVTLRLLKIFKYSLFYKD